MRAANTTGNSAATPMPELSVVIPAFNEAERIQSSLDDLVTYLRSRERPFEIIVVDDGSTDGTYEQVEARKDPEIFVLRSPENEGKGAAVRRGVLESRGRNILLSDADACVSIEQLPPFELALASHPIVCASKALPDSRALAPQPALRRATGRLFNAVVRGLGLSRLRDTQCGFKLFRGDVARELFVETRIRGFAFDVELLYLAGKRGYSAVELPVRWEHVGYSQVHPIRGAGRVFRDLLSIRFTPEAPSGTRTSPQDRGEHRQRPGSTKRSGVFGRDS